MGSYACKLKHGRGQCAYATTSSREIILIFSNGRRWKMPEMILHYIADHNWLPPVEFIEDLLRISLDPSPEDMTYVNPGAEDIDERFGIVRIGYLEAIVPTPEVGVMPELAWRNLFGYLTFPDKLPGRRIIASFG